MVIRFLPLPEEANLPIDKESGLFGVRSHFHICVCWLLLGAFPDPRCVVLSLPCSVPAVASPRPAGCHVHCGTGLAMSHAPGPIFPRQQLLSAKRRGKNNTVEPFSPLVGSSAVKAVGLRI